MQISKNKHICKYISICVCIYKHTVTYTWLYAQNHLNLIKTTNYAHKQYLMGIDLKLFGELFQILIQVFFEPRSPVQSFSSNRLAVQDPLDTTSIPERWQTPTQKVQTVYIHRGALNLWGLLYFTKLGGRKLGVARLQGAWIQSSIATTRSIWRTVPAAGSIQPAWEIGKLNKDNRQIPYKSLVYLNRETDAFIYPPSLFCMGCHAQPVIHGRDLL